MNGLFEGTYGQKIRGLVGIVLITLALFLAFAAMRGFMELRFVGAGIMPTNTITVSGTGESYAVPDIGSFSFSVVSDKKTVADAQSDATATINSIMAYLKDAGVAEKDIKTSNYSISPRYEYQSAACPALSPVSSATVYCPPGRQVLVGYEVRQSTEVKVRDTSKAGDLLAGIGTHGATDVSGLSFTVEDPDAVEAEARNKAITDAKEKADVLARQLGVSLVRIVAFSENNGGYAVPMAYGMGGDAMSFKASSPEISVGQNKTTSTVSITYEIR